MLHEHDRKVTRFDNVSTSDLEAREREAREELRDLQNALRNRLEKEAADAIEIGGVYRITEGRFEGRLMLVMGFVAAIPDVMQREPYRTLAWGRLNGKSAAGDGWTIKSQQVNIKRLTRA